MTLYAVGAHAPEIPPKPSAGRSGGWVLRGFAILQAPMLPLSRARQTQGRRKGGRTNPSDRGAKEGGVEEGRISSVRGTSSRRRVPRTVCIQCITRTHNSGAEKRPCTTLWRLDSLSLGGYLLAPIATPIVIRDEPTFGSETAHGLLRVRFRGNVVRAPSRSPPSPPPERRRARAREHTATSLFFAYILRHAFSLFLYHFHASLSFLHMHAYGRSPIKHPTHRTHVFNRSDFILLPLSLSLLSFPDRIL